MWGDYPARQLLNEDSINYLDLKYPASLTRLEEPITALQPLKGTGSHRRNPVPADLFPALRVLADQSDLPARFPILSKSSGELLQQRSDSLAGCIERIPIGGFLLRELSQEAEQRLWLRGGFPFLYLARSGADNVAWRKQFMQSLHESGIPQWRVRVTSSALQRF